MKYITGNELRQKFLDFFASKDHLVLPSYSLVPDNDPTLLLIGAGMAPFKPYFTGKITPPKSRIVTSQRCMRTGDIDNVGRTARHQTFFEMLGNFSFGDYFKHEAIGWAWEFLTRHLEIPVDQLWVTIYPDDDEAFDIWTRQVGVAPERIVKLKDNFWEIGPGPCGPCSEIYVDLGAARGCNSPTCSVGCDCDRFLEIWNLVFTQFDRDEDGQYHPLEKKNIDTGAGLERIASVLQNKPSNFETDLLFPLVEYAAQTADIQYGQAANSDISLKVIADHARSMTFMIADGVLPSNEGRGYVLRRIIRRAVRHARLIGIEQSFLAAAVDVVVQMFAQPYPQLAEQQQSIRKVVEQEEVRFQATLAQGSELLNKHIDGLKESGLAVLAGAEAFKLYDTFGFPWELTAEILAEHGMALDRAAFDEAMNEQRQRARAARHQNQHVELPDLSGLIAQAPVYDVNACQAAIVAMWTQAGVVDEAYDGQQLSVVLDVTSFYAEGGGQVGDNGCLEGSMGKMMVTAVKKLPDGTIYHSGVIEEGGFKTGDRVKLLPDCAKKIATACHHTATHLLHAAVRSVLGDHVNQAGSLVDADRLRFDFSHFEAITPQQLADIERIVNDIILAGCPVAVIEATQSEARQMGATALFGEKYGDVVRVISIGDYSKELCGGTHVDNTAQISLFKITGESGVAAGVRRIEALAGGSAIAYLNAREQILLQAAQLLKTRPEDLLQRLNSLTSHVKELEHTLAAAASSLAKLEVEKLFECVRQVNGIDVVSGCIKVGDADALRQAADMVRERLDCGVVVLAAVFGSDKVNFVAMATKAAVAKGVHAGNIVKAAAKIAGGGGGGRPDMAQAGGKLPNLSDQALAAAYAMIEKQVQ